MVPHKPLGHKAMHAVGMIGLAGWIVAFIHTSRFVIDVNGGYQQKLASLDGRQQAKQRVDLGTVFLRILIGPQLDGVNAGTDDKIKAPALNAEMFAE